MKQTLTDIISSFVDNPDVVTVEETENEGVTTLTIQAAKEDLGKVIGKEGRVIKALKNVMKIPAMRENKRIYVTITDTE